MKWNKYFLRMAVMVSEKSKDPRTKVGAVITGPDNGVRSTGFNGFPREVCDTVHLVPERYQPPEKYLWTEHAERNAIYNAARNGTSTNGCTIYSTMQPCVDCARAIIQAGIIRVVYVANRKTVGDCHQDTAMDMMLETCIDVRMIELHEES